MDRRSMLRAAACLAVTVLLSSCFGGGDTQERFSGIHIDGNRIVDQAGRAIQLRGVSARGSEYACVEPIYTPERKAFFDIPVDDDAISAMGSWGVNAVRVPLNEQCWLGVNPVVRGGEPNFQIKILRDDKKASDGLARAYQDAIGRYVRRLERHGLVVILDLHWSAPGDSLAFKAWPMPDVDNSPKFWRSVATTFRDHRSVIFELFRGPYTRDPALLSWSCLRAGCELPNACSDCEVAEVLPACNACPTVGRPDGTYRAAGMQSLVDAVRSTGARQPILTPGRHYSNDLERWLDYRPKDPLNQIGASFHVYEGMPCQEEGCWNRVIAKVAAEVPVVATEFGPYVYDRKEPCRDDATFDRRFMRWADAHRVSYLAWSWHRDTNIQPPACSSGLVSAYGGTPRAGHGRAVRDHFRARG